MQDFASNNGKDEDLEGKISLNYQNDIGKNLSLSSRKLHSGLPHNEVADLLQFRVFELSTEAKYHYMNKGEIEIINFSMCLDTKSDQNRVAKIQNNINYSTNTDANNAEERYSSDFLNFFKYVEKNPDSKEFKYLVRRNESLNPYDLKIVDYFEIDQKSSLGFYTVSAQGLTHTTREGNGSYIPINQWLREQVLFSGLQKIPFFFEYKRRKFLDQWRNIVLHKKIELSGKILQSEAFILDKSLQQVLLKVKEAIEIFNAYDDDRRTQEENIFKENNYRLLEAAKQKVLKEQGFVEANTDSRHLSFTAQAARKSEIARFSRFLKLVELLYPPLSA